jgi:hypothetical protein
MAMLIVPQSDRFEQQYRVATAIGDVGSSRMVISEITGISERHVSYAVQALWTLGFLDQAGLLTDLGRELVRATSDDERLFLFRQAVASSSVIQMLAPGLGTRHFQLSRAQLASRIQDVSSYSHVTASRRAGTLESWHRQLLAPKLPFGPKNNGHPGMKIELTKKLGSGSFGDVWMGTDQLDRCVAVKFLNNDVAGIHDLLLDAKALSRLNHPNVVRVHTVESLPAPDGSGQLKEAIVMEYIPGVTLKARLADGILSGEEVERIGLGCIEGVKALHAAGIVHEDLHDVNVLVSAEVVKIIDPYYQETLRADDADTRVRRMRKDVESLRAILNAVAENSARGLAEWLQHSPRLAAATSVDEIETVFHNYLVAVQGVTDLRPGRESFPIPAPGKAQVAAITKFFLALNFNDDPFFHTNAANEDLLKSYFIRPKYYRSLQGDGRRPGSAIVFAPRGSGKTAQARMLATHAVDSALLPLSYDLFPGQSKSTAKSPTLDYHLANVVRRGAGALVLYLFARDIPFGALGELEEAFGSLCYCYLRDIGTDELGRLRANPLLAGLVPAELWKGSLTSGVRPGEWLFRRCQEMGLLATAISKSASSPRRDFEVLKAVAKKLRFEGIIVLVDRVDEAPYAANHAERTYRLVEALLSDLQVLEDDYVGWKLFLWDRAQPFLDRRGRGDRIPTHELEWSESDLREMLEARLRAYSDGRVTSLVQMASYSCLDEVDSWPFIFANGSPRNLIRILQAVVGDEIERGTHPPLLTLEGLENGISTFAATHAREVASRKSLQTLRRIGTATFTIRDVARKLKIKGAAARSRVLSLENEGIVHQAGTIRIKAEVKPSNHYVIREPTVLAHSCGLTIGKLLSMHYVSCEDCGHRFFTGTERRLDHPTCPVCDSEVPTFTSSASEE